MPLNKKTAYWNAGQPLSNAAIHFASSELKEAWKDLSNKSALAEATKKLEAVQDQGLDAASVFSTMMEGITSVTSPRLDISNSAKSDLMAKLKKGTMTALGFEKQRVLTSKPECIPQSCWSGHIRWDKAELKHQSLHFIEIRVVSDQMIEALDEKLATKAEVIRQISKPQKGRPTIRPQITKAFVHLHGKGTFVSGMSIKHASEYVRQQLAISYPELNVTESKPSFEAIRRVISPLMKANENNKQ